jgi:hypothetical protein
MNYYYIFADIKPQRNSVILFAQLSEVVLLLGHVQQILYLSFVTGLLLT